MAIDQQTLRFYERHSAEVAARYQAVTDGASRWFDEAFDGVDRILDVGCGSGRDLCLLLQKGHDAVGTDASPAMLAAAAETLRQAGINPENRLIEDSLPDLATVADESFDGILCSAVLMHVPEERLFDSVYGMRRVLRPGGRLLLSIPAARPDVDAITRRDPDGRYFADIPPAKLKLLLERVGFHLLWEKETNDSLARTGYSWVTMLCVVR